ncbi:MAG: transcriptional regulator, LysR family [Rhizobacter sp.]|nr:transcriptional regulator, LysR family [Rhizobacter sp.]
MAALCSRRERFQESPHSKVFAKRGFRGLQPHVSHRSSGYADPFMADGRLVQALADWSPRLPPLTLYCPDRRRDAPKLRALIEFSRATPVEPIDS